jgi:hypothetical protein
LNDPQNRTADPGFDLASLLNILWRRRLIAFGLPLLGLLVGVAYGVMGTRRWEALATVRPGITAFDPGGGPVRQWQLKDVTRWYEKMLYRKELNARLGLPAASHHVIQAEFIATGLTNLSGGEVITLWTTATSPELAAALIDTSLVLFNEYAEADSTSSQIQLTRVGLQLKIGELRNRLLAVDRQEARIVLDMETAKAESLRVTEQTRSLAVDLKELAQEEEYCKARITGLAAERRKLEAEVAWLEEADGDQPLEMVAAARLQARHALSRNQAESDSLGFAAELAVLQAERLGITRPAEIAAQLRAAEKKLGDLRLERKLDVTAKRNELEFEISARRSKLGMLSPLQRVGGTVVSDRPVRPRPLRASAILVFLGILGGFSLAFVWDYVAANRRRIFRS